LWQCELVPLATVIKPLLLPPTVLVLLALLGLLIARRRRGFGLGVAALALVLLYLAATPIVGSRLLVAQQDYTVRDATAARASGAGAIVVISADQRRDQPDYRGETVGPATFERLRRAARLQRETGLPLLVSGGLLPGFATAHADAMAEALEVDLRVPVRWREGLSRTTAENATYSARLLKAEGITRVLLVTTAWHIPRAVQAFRAAGLDPLPVPTGFVVASDWTWENMLPSAAGLQQTTWACHEVLGRIWYRLLER
jgi:uncharacterized SAM-binding protein YcdF (DUF218 family)